jgi:glycosyltransferase involved in cell wall biosynthesis
MYVTVSMPFGPGEAFFIDEVKELLRQGHQLLIVPRSPRRALVNRDADGLQNVSLRRPLFSPAILAGAALVCLTRPLATFRALTLLAGSKDLFTLLKNLVVFPKALWLGRLATRWKAEHIHAQWGLTTATMAMVASRIFHIPWSCTVHRGDIIDNNLLELKARDAQFMRVISEDGISLAADICGRPLEGNVVMLHLGVELPALPPGQRPLHSPAALLCPAQLIERKGHQYLIEALGILRQRGQTVRLQIAGEGHMREFLESLTAQLGLQDAVEFMGQVQHAGLLQLYQAGNIDMVVLPTLHEGIPVCLMEAMAHGVPVVSTAAGGIPELLRDGAGIIVSPKSPPELADAIESLIRDPELRARLVAAGRRRIETAFSVEAVVHKLVDYLQNAKA